jgi:hypothetical protein
MATAQITTAARFQAISAAYTRNAENEIVVKEGENLDTIFARVLGLVNLKPEEATESQKTQFRNSFPVVQNEVFARSTKIANEAGEEVNAYDYLSGLKVKVTDMIKKLRSDELKDRVLVEGKFLPVPEGFAGSGRKGRKAVDTMSYFSEI